ncbi:MAG: hypothetical protein AXW16_06640 [Cycloclasticus sp. Phe_18]|nr:MAG: hypothetical protein AXW16_06640 [Cycloclasticus sp. Phe_18]
MNIKKYGAIVTHIGERVILLQISCLHTVFLDKLGNVNLFLCVLFISRQKGAETYQLKVVRRDSGWLIVKACMLV